MNPAGFTEGKHSCYICFAKPFGVHILVVNASAWMVHIVKHFSCSIFS